MTELPGPAPAGSPAPTFDADRVPAGAAEPAPAAQPQAEGERDRERERDRVLLYAGLLSLWGPVAGGYAAYLGRSMVLVADMLRSGTDSVGLILSWWAYRTARSYTGPDRRQRAQRMDRASGMLIAVVMWISAAVIGVGAVREFVDPQPIGKILAGLLVAVGGGAYNGWFWWKYLTFARETGAALFHAQWRLYRAKAAANATVLITLIAGRVLHAQPWAQSIDAAGAVVVAAFLAVSGVAAARKARGAGAAGDHPPA